MNQFSSLMAGLRARWAPEREVRAEAWALGVRYRGEVVQGARSELAAPDLSFARAVLLRAVIRQEQRAANA